MLSPRQSAATTCGTVAMTLHQLRKRSRVLVLVWEDHRGYTSARRVTEGSGPSPIPVWSLAGAAAGRPTYSPAVVEPGCPAGEQARPQPHRHRTGPRLLQLEETGR